MDDHDVEVGIAVMSGESTVWRRHAGVFAAIATTVQPGREGTGLSLTRAQAGLYFQLIVGPYQRVVALVAERARQASSEMAKISGTLGACADTYAAEERRGLHAAKGLY